MPLDFMDKDRNVINHIQWMRLKEDADYCRIARDEFPGGYVSTVWLGAMLSNLGIFETMVFHGDTPGQQVRYDTLEAALLGHQAVCADLALVMPPAVGPPVAPDQEPDEEHGNGTE